MQRSLGKCVTRIALLLFYDRNMEILKILLNISLILFFFDNLLFERFNSEFILQLNYTHRVCRKYEHFQVHVSYEMQKKSDKNACISTSRKLYVHLGCSRLLSNR